MKYEVYNPFLKLEEILQEFVSEKLDGIFVDFHRETSAEMYGMGFMFDGRLSLLYGTHTHIQTNDEQILPE
jgi:2',3'-cyclic-nucleotide 2'-phosphodiesterase